MIFSLQFSSIPHPLGFFFVEFVSCFVVFVVGFSFTTKLTKRRHEISRRKRVLPIAEKVAHDAGCYLLFPRVESDNPHEDLQ